MFVGSVCTAVVQCVGATQRPQIFFPYGDVRDATTLLMSPYAYGLLISR